MFTLYSDLRDDLCKTIIADMNEYGLSVIDDFLGRAKGLEILSEVDNMYGAGVFRVSSHCGLTGFEPGLRCSRVNIYISRQQFNYKVKDIFRRCTVRCPLP